jgi:hypothetical protein
LKKPILGADYQLNNLLTPLFAMLFILMADICFNE